MQHVGPEISAIQLLPGDRTVGRRAAAEHASGAAKCFVFAQEARWRTPCLGFTNMMRARALTGTFPFLLRRRRFVGWVRRKTEPKLSTVIVELPSVDVALPREWEPTMRIVRRGLEPSLLVPLVALSALVVAAATMVSS